MYFERDVDVVLGSAKWDLQASVLRELSGYLERYCCFLIVIICPLCTICQVNYFLLCRT